MHSNGTDAEINRLLGDWSQGDPQALNKLIPLVTDELRRMARRYFMRESPGHTLQPTALVNEVYMKLAGRRTVHWKNRAQFFAVVAEMMRQILVDHARRQKAAKHGGGATRMSIDEVVGWISEPQVDLLALHNAIDKLAALDPRQARIVVFKFFGGLTHEEIGEVLGIHANTVKREWKTAKTWLFHVMSNGEGESQ